MEQAKDDSTKRLLLIYSYSDLFLFWCDTATLFSCLLFPDAQTAGAVKDWDAAGGKLPGKK